MERGKSEIVFRDTGGYLELSDVAGVMGFSLEQLEAWLDGWTHPQATGLVVKNNRRLARKSVVLRDWYEALWIAHGLRPRQMPRPRHEQLRQWQNAIHALPVLASKKVAGKGA